MRHTLVWLVGLAALPLGVPALEQSTVGLEGPQASVNVLNSKIDTLAATTNAALNKLQTCNTQGMFYDPTNKNADSDGCYNGVKVCSAKGMYFDPSRPKSQTDADSCFAMVPNVTRRIDNQFSTDGWVTARAQCASDEVVVGGGFWCSGPDMGKSYPTFSGPYVTGRGTNNIDADTPTAWNSACINTWNGTSVRAISFVYCMKVQAQTHY